MAENIEPEEFQIPESKISFEKAITSLHNLGDSAFHSFMYRFVQSLSLKQLNNLKKYVQVKETGRNP